MKVDGKALAKEALERRKMNKKMGDDAPKEVDGAIMEQGAHIKAMASLIEALHAKDAEKAHEHMMMYTDAYTKMKS